MERTAFALRTRSRGNLPRPTWSGFRPSSIPGLKKNVIYDLLHGNQLDKINPESSFQYYDLGCLWEHISLILREGIPLIHLFPEPLTTAGMIDRLFAGMAIGGDAGRPVITLSRPGMPACSAAVTAISGLREEVYRRISLFVYVYRNGTIG